ncbi:carbon catabolite repressor protein 4 homolog 3 isoform X3 [Mercurialis annua]|uniref:carbon catabolite repressor protein 4 homolog 3 isoform X3 n=1 Tax=Mercurialis annua TaxID=3986 RepID=UPI00215F7D48|nr:carbon catabolite repressor protein 4 homolog 3 isoform X3 [Mercurialis annua]
MSPTNVNHFLSSTNHPRAISSPAAPHMILPPPPPHRRRRQPPITLLIAGRSVELLLLKFPATGLKLINQMHTKGRTGGNVDGCAMFWKADKLRLLEGESIEFKALGLRDNVAQLSVFETCKAEPRRLLVGNIHVLYNPSRGEVKLGQIRNLLSRAQILAEKWGDVPVILAGDFNSTPKSPIYEFFASSELDVMLYSRREMSGQRNCHPPQVFGVEKEMSNPLSLMEGFLNCWSDEELKTATGDSNYNLVTHALKLKSSYATVKGSTRTRDLTGEPVATSYHSKFLGTVDYLWYSDGVVPIRVLDTLSFDILRKTGGLPSKELGSDHLALVSEFVFIPGASEGSHLITDELT